MTDDLVIPLSNDLQPYVINPDDYKLIEQIGYGGFSEVWLAEDKNSGDKVAFKRIRSDITKSEIQCYIREITTMAKADHPFFLHLIGFSVSFPLVIVTEYIPNRSLFRFRRSPERNSRLTPTARTIIALCLSYAMKHLHAIGIIHRDLKSMNVLLDDNLLPKLCDFGVARFLQSDEPMTKSAGTPNWMAPELNGDASYGPEVDVYSFAMILYELITDEIPWKNLDPIAVLRKVVVEHQRPRIPECIDSSLRNLVEMCWNDDPSQRPTFKEIYEMFKSGNVAFPGTDSAQVAKIIEKIKKYEATGKWLSINTKIPSRSTPASPLPRQAPVNTGVMRSARSGSLIVSRSSANRSQPFFKSMMNENTKSNSNMLKSENKFISIEAINDPQSFSFKAELQKASVKLPKLQSRLFMSVITNYLKNTENISVTSLVLKSLQKIVQKKHHRDSFIKAGLHKILPLSPGSLLDLSLDIYNILFSQAPTKFSDWFKPAMVTIIDERPKRAIILLSHYAKFFERIPNSWPLLDLLIKKAQIFLSNSCEIELVSTLFYLCFNFDEYKEARLKQAIKIFLSTLESDDIKSICLSYNALSHFYDKNLVKIDYGLVIEHLDTEQTAPYALGLLVRINELPAIPELILSLLNNSLEYHEANLCLVKIAALEEGASFLLKKSEWMLERIPTTSDTLRLFLALMTHANLRPIISKTSNAIAFLAKISKNYSFLAHVAIIIRKVAPDKNCLLEMRETDLVKRFIDSALKNHNDDKLENLVLHAIYAMSETGYAPEYVEYCDRLKYDIITKGRNRLSAMAVAADLARYPNCAEKFSELDMDSVFTKLMSENDCRDYAEEYIANMQRHK